jgi:hypothetical protein
VIELAKSEDLPSRGLRRRLVAAGAARILAGVRSVDAKGAANCAAGLRVAAFRREGDRLSLIKIG